MKLWVRLFGHKTRVRTIHGGAVVNCNCGFRAQVGGLFNNMDPQDAKLRATAIALAHVRENTNRG